MRAVIVLLVMMVSATAMAESVRRPGMIVWEKPTKPPAAAPSSRIIYVHRCPQQGCLIKPGPNDSRVDTSALADQQLTISKFKQSDAVWDAMMTCVKNTYAPFNITVTDVDPGNVPHYENIVGGNSGAELSPDFASAGGVSPFSCGEIENSISFTFDVYGPDVDQLCWTVAQETAHSFGLEHEYNAADPLTYISGGPSKKRFQATDSKCGTFSALSSCACPQGAPRPTQNSYRFIVDMFGPGAATPPTISIVAPTQGKKVQPGSVVRVNATDDVAVDHVELWIDGADSGVKAMTAPYRLALPTDLADGTHALELRAIDVQGVPASDTVDVEMGPPCTASKGCSGDDVCVSGVCVPGPDVPGGIGDSCTQPAECLSQQCVGTSASGKLCVETCDPADSGSCPSDFSCLPNGASGVCYYNGSGGCCSAGTEPTGPLLLGASVLGVVMFRRRRRR